MNIQIVTRKVDNIATLRKTIENKVGNAIDSVAERVDRVIVKLENDSHSHDCFSCQCRIDAWLIPTGHIHVSAKSESTLEVVAAAAKKLEQAIKHDIDRHRRSSNIRHQQGKRKFIASLEDSSHAESNRQ